MIERITKETLKVGDQMIVSTRNGQSITTVTRLLKNYFETTSGKKFDYMGHERGGDRFYWATIRQATPESLVAIREENARRHALSCLTCEPWLNRLPTAELVALFERCKSLLAQK